MENKNYSRNKKKNMHLPCKQEQEDKTEKRRS